MALPIAIAAASAGLSVLGGIAQNKAITQAATAQYEANKLFIERDYSVTSENLMFQAGEVNKELGMALTALNQEVNRLQGKVTTKQVESNVYGNTAERQQMVLQIQKELQKDSLAQAAESKMVDVQTQMRNAKYATEAQHAQNMQNYSNMMSKRQSTLSLVANGLSAAASGYSMGQGMELASAKLDALKNTSAQLGQFTPK